MVFTPPQPFTPMMLTWFSKISSVEAIPYDEFKTNPYTVLCTTNWGGHLSWFQLGGKRWFATAVAAFLMKMEDGFEVVPPPKAEAKENGWKFPVWDPSNRRMNMQLPI